VGAFEHLSRGDLSRRVEVNGRDEISKLAHSFENIRQELKGLIGNVMQNSARVTDTARMLSAQADQTSAAANANASTVSEVSATVDNLVVNIKEVSGRADQGRQNIDSIVATMEQIEQSVGQVSMSVSSLSQAINKIEQFVDTINGIADQTNLLALNAAIEAARAGDAGRGFAVVAEEVRKHAENSALSAKEINKIISEVQSQSARAVKDMEGGRERVAHGDKVVREVSLSLTSIIELVQDLSRKTGEVAAAAAQMGGAMQNMSTATEEQTAAMEEVSASTIDLTRLSGELSSQVGRFKI